MGIDAEFQKEINQFSSQMMMMMIMTKQQKTKKSVTISGAMRNNEKRTCLCVSTICTHITEHPKQTDFGFLSSVDDDDDDDAVARDFGFAPGM